MQILVDTICMTVAELLYTTVAELLCTTVAELELARSACTEKTDQALAILRKVCDRLCDFALCEYFIEKLYRLLFANG